MMPSLPAVASWSSNVRSWLQLLEQLARQPVHARSLATLVVIVTAQVQRAMHEQPLQLDDERSAVFACLAFCRFDGHDDVAKRLAGHESIADVKRKNVGRFVFSAKRAVEPGYLAVTGKHDRYFAPYTRCGLRNCRRDRPTQRRRRQPPATGAAHDHARFTRRHGRMPL
jgi:hypothetical protein